MAETTEPQSKFSEKRFVIGCIVLFLSSVVLILFPLGIYARSLFITIQSDEVAVVLSPNAPNGISEIPLTPGNHFVSPLDKLEIFNFSKEKYISSSTNCGCGPDLVTFHAKQGAEIFVDYQITYSINPEQVVKLYQAWQHRYQDGFVIPQSIKIIGEVASQYTSSEIALTKRNEVEQAIFSRLKSDFSESNLIVFEFKIDDVRLNK